MKLPTTVARACLALGLVGLAWPASPAHAEGELLGFDGTSQSVGVRIAVYDPSIPLPATPQGDVGFGYARANGVTGPSTRGLSSYLWPGDVLGDGLGVLTMNEDLDYPVKVNSRFPATGSAPAQNSAQITKGNGMSTSASETLTTARTTGFGVTGPDSLTGPGDGLCQVVPSDCPDTPESPAPLEVPAEIAALATFDDLVSNSTFELRGATIEVTAHTHVEDLSLLGGVITAKSVDLLGISASDGIKATHKATARVTGLEIGGQKIAVERGRVDLAGTPTEVPAIPSEELKAVGIAIDYLPSVEETDAGKGSLIAQGLVVDIDLALLRDTLGAGAVTGPLSDALAGVPQLGPILSGLAKLGSRVVISVGDLSTKVAASPAFTPEPVDTGDTTTDSAGDAPDSGPGVNVGGSPASSSGGLSAPTPGLPASSPAQDDAPPSSEGVTNTAAEPFALPGLGRVPTLLLLVGLVLAGLLGQGLRGFGTLLLGSPRCMYGLNTSVPDLRRK